MNKRTSYLVKAALIAAVYTVLTHLQNIIFPGFATGMIQFRASEAMCVLAFFTPAAIPGLSLGCMMFNLTSGAALPLDFLLGTAATAAAVIPMWLCRNVTIKGFPFPAILFPVISNAIIVGFELSVYVGGGFPINALYIAIGEGAVMLTFGIALYYIIKLRKLDKKLFS